MLLALAKSALAISKATFDLSDTSLLIIFLASNDRSLSWIDFADSKDASAFDFCALAIALSIVIRMSPFETFFPWMIDIELIVPSTFAW